MAATALPKLAGKNDQDGFIHFLNCNTFEAYFDKSLLPLIRERSKMFGEEGGGNASGSGTKDLRLLKRICIVL
jgi:hypothetical protein